MLAAELWRPIGCCSTAYQQPSEASPLAIARKLKRIPRRLLQLRTKLYRSVFKTSFHYTHQTPIDIAQLLLVLDNLYVMVCSVCRQMFHRQAGSVWKYRHHTSCDSLLESSKQNCGICRPLYEDFKSKITIDESDGESKSQVNKAGITDHASRIVAVLATAAWFVSTGAFSLVSSALSMLCFNSLSSSMRVAVPATMPLANPGELATMPLSVQASLSVHMNSDVEHLYRLDMTLHYERKKQQLRVQRTFFLENPSKSLGLTQEDTQNANIFI